MNLDAIYQFFIFATIGVFNTLTDFALWKILTKIFDKNTPLVNFFKKNKLNTVSVAHFISFSTVVILSYFMNKNLTFGKSNKSFEGDSFFKFIIINVTNLVLSTLIIQKLSTNQKIKNWVQNQHPLFSKNFYNFIKLGTVFFTMLISFFGYKIFVF